MNYADLPDLATTPPDELVRRYRAILAKRAKEASRGKAQAGELSGCAPIGYRNARDEATSEVDGALGGVTLARAFCPMNIGSGKRASLKAIDLFEDSPKCPCTGWLVVTSELALGPEDVRTSCTAAAGSIDRFTSTGELLLMSNCSRSDPTLATTDSSAMCHFG